LLLALLLPAAVTGPFARWHFDFGRAMKVSILFARRPVGDETRLLLEVPSGRFELLSRQDPSGNDSTESVTWAGSGETRETLERRILLSGWETVRGCEGVRHPDACLLWKGANGEVTARMSQFSGEGAASTRQKVAALVSPPFRERLFSLSEVLPVMAEFGSFTTDFLALVWPDRFGIKQRLERGKRTPGCDFDAGFGYPCSPPEREKEHRRFPGMQ